MKKIITTTKAPQPIGPYNQAGFTFLELKDPFMYRLVSHLFNV